MSDSIQTHFRACHLCEAICGLEIKTQGDDIISIKGDKNDPVSHGFICPKATAIADIHNDPDRLRMPHKREGDKWLEITWDEAIEIAAQNIASIQQEHGNDAVGFFGGNPGVHNYGNLTHGPAFRRVVRTKNHFSATSLDQLPHQLTSWAMYGHQFALPIPDVDQTQIMVIMGGNPLASNGSIMTMPNAPKRLKAIKDRGGKLVVIDPRRTETADIASQHLFIKPGADAYVLMAMINTLFTNELVKETHLSDYTKGLDTVRAAVSGFTLERAEAESGISVKQIQNLTEELANTDKAVLYGRMGVSVQEFGALCQWAIQVINILIGATDSVGGAMLTSPAFAYVTNGAPGAGHFDRFKSRVSGLPEFSGELPAVTLAEEILTPGDGQIKAMVTIAGNPVISSANSSDMERAFESLDFYVAFDFYINATTRHANLILPPTSPLEHDHFDIAFLRFAVHNSVRLNPAIFEPQKGHLHDWEAFNLVGKRLAELKNIDFKPLPAPADLVDHGIQNDVYGPAQNPTMSLTMAKVKAAPHGIDLGPLKPSLTTRIATKDGLIDCAPGFLINDLNRLADRNVVTGKNDLLLIGRRHIRSNNSWMHNYHRLVKGKPRWQLMMHPDDLASRGLDDQSEVIIKSRVGEVKTIVIATDELMPGVVSLPHGWGHNKKGVKLNIAVQQQGVNCNELTDDKFIDQLCGNAALNGVPVTVEAA